MNELKEKISEVVEKIKTMDWKEFIGVQFLALFAVVVIIGGVTVGLKDFSDQSAVPEHPTEMWGKAESSKSSDQSEMLAGTNDSYVGPFKADLGNSKSPTVEGSQAGPTTVDYVDSALPVDDTHTGTAATSKKNPTDDIRNDKYLRENYDIPWPDDNNRVSNGRIAEPPVR